MSMQPIVSKVHTIRVEISGAARYFSEVKVLYEASVTICYNILRNFSEHAVESSLSGHTM